MPARSTVPAHSSKIGQGVAKEPGAAELVLVSSGPGELSNWAVPMAQAAVAWAARREMPLALSLILPPCQFASGQEIAFARRQGVFARILGPRACLGLVTGLARFPVAGSGCLLHLGGDLWYSATLGRRLGYSAFAYAETPLVRKRAHRFERVFLPTQALARRLLDDGVAARRLAVVGDLRVDHLATVRTRAGERPGGVRVALLPGSRRWLVEGALPIFLEAATAMRRHRSEIEFSLVLSPFLPRDMLAQILAPHQAALTALGVDAVQEDHLAAMAHSDFAITLPGTNTVELAILGVPMLVAVPLHRPDRIRMEGMPEWFGRIPVLGAAIKGMIARRLIQNPRLLAWPNREAGRSIVPELMGVVTAEDIARRALALLDDPRGLEQMARELRGLYVTPHGVAQRMLDTMAPYLHSATDRSTDRSTVPAE